MNIAVRDACFFFHGESALCQFSDRFRESRRQKGREGCFLFLLYSVRAKSAKLYNERPDNKYSMRWSTHSLSGKHSAPPMEHKGNPRLFRA